MNVKIYNGTEQQHRIEVQREYIQAMKDLNASIKKQDIKAVKENYVQIVRLSPMVGSSPSNSLPKIDEEQDMLKALFESCIELYLKSASEVDYNRMTDLISSIKGKNPTYIMIRFIEENFDLLIDSEIAPEEVPTQFRGRLARAKKQKHTI